MPVELLPSELSLSNEPKVAPPLVITESQVEQYLDATEAVMETVHSSASFWSDALNMAQRAVRI